MSLRATINVHFETNPMKAVISEIGAFSVALILSDPSDYGDLTLFFPSNQKGRVEKIATLINEMMAPQPAPVESESA